MSWGINAELDCYERGVLSYCSPNEYSSPAADRLFRNDGDGTFTDVSQASGVSFVFGNRLGAVGADFDQKRAPRPIRCE